MMKREREREGTSEKEMLGQRTFTTKLNGAIGLLAYDSPAKKKEEEETTHVVVLSIELVLN